MACSHVTSFLFLFFRPVGASLTGIHPNMPDGTHVEHVMFPWVFGCQNHIMVSFFVWNQPKVVGRSQYIMLSKNTVTNVICLQGLYLIFGSSLNSLHVILQGSVPGCS